MEDSTNKNLFYAKFGDMEYSFTLSLFNSSESPIKRPPDCIFLQKNSLILLEIVDSIFNPFHTGTLIISNQDNYLESGEQSYTFLGNGRDIVDLEIVSISTGKFDEDTKNKENKMTFGMRFQFSVIECEDILYNEATCKKLELVECAQYQLSENICNIFGVQKPKGGVSSYMDTNGGMSCSTIDMIKRILQAVYKEDLMYTDPKTGEQIFEGDGESILNLNPYGPMSYAEVLNYVMSFHSYQKSPCILNFDRFTKKFMLLSLSRLFKENEKRVVETLYFPTGGEDDAHGTCSIKWDYKKLIFDESKIDSFYVSAPTCKYNVFHAANAGILSSSRGFKSMVFDLTTLNSDNFSKEFFDLFLKPFESVFKDNKVVPNYYLSPNKENNYSSHKGNLPPILDEKKFLNSKLQSLLYLNNVYKFKLRGKISRQTLRFVDVLRNSQDASKTPEPTDWELNNLGRHLIVNVKHIFNQNTYINEVETIKPYRFTNPKKDGNASIKDYLSFYGA